MSEFAYINWLRRLTPTHPHVLLGPGDDAAALKLSPSAPCLMTTDMLLEGSCFHLAEAGPRRVGRKAMAVNLSDIRTNNNHLALDRTSDQLQQMTSYKLESEDSGTGTSSLNPGSHLMTGPTH